ncbi:MAG: hypothetical protein RLZZ573_402 [Pseudomonadota bacterium]|jgi:hydroxymethylpyrimidine pyrophosphatase-like HAD family hydrolase
MLPPAHWTLQARRNLIGVFTDIDDTLTTEGAITPDALAALGQLKAAGLQLIAITGRPIGWSEPFACGDAERDHAPWPVDAIVAENGAAMQRVVAQVLREVPGATVSQDSAGRETDIARVVALMQAAGMNATVSSIHIHGWFGSHNKLEGARWIVGDSTNDQLMFAHFAHSVGVTNIRRFEAALTHLPRYITPSARGAGFAEVAAAIVQVHAP